MKLASGQIAEIEHLNRLDNRPDENQPFREDTIEEFCTRPFVVTGKDTGRSEFMVRIKQFKVSDKKKAMIKIRGFIDRNEKDALLKFVEKINKKVEFIPYEVIMEYLESVDKKHVRFKILQKLKNLIFSKFLVSRIFLIVGSLLLMSENSLHSRSPTHTLPDMRRGLGVPLFA